MTRPPKDTAIQRLQRALDAIEDLKQSKHRSSSPEFIKWRRNTKIAIAHTFEKDSSQMEDFAGISYSLFAVSPSTTDSDWQQAYIEGLERSTAILQSMIEEIEEYWEDDSSTTISTSQNQKGSEHMQTDKFEYDIALSFAGEDRAVVERVATGLKNRGIRVFYDDFERAALWGKILYEYLADLYSKRSKFCVVFVSQSYKEKRWTRHERRAAQERAFNENQEYILPVRLDDTELPGLLSTVGYLDLREVSVQMIIDSAVEKVSEFNQSEEPRHREVHAADKEPMTAEEERRIKSLLSISCNPRVDGSLSDLQKSANKASFGVEFPRDYGIVIGCPFSLAASQSRVQGGLVSRHPIPTQMKPYSGMQCEEELSLHTDGSVSFTYAYTFDGDTEPNFALELYIKQLVYALHFYERMLAATNVEAETAAIRTKVLIPDGAFLFDQNGLVDTEMQPAYYVGDGAATKEILVGMSGSAFQEDTADLTKRLSNGVLDSFEFDSGRAGKGIPGLESEVIEHVVSVIQSHIKG